MAGILRHQNDQVGLCHFRIRQEGGLRAASILLAQLADLTEGQSAVRTSVDAVWIESFVQPVFAGVALGHFAGRLIERERTVGAGSGAHAAADALALINQNQSVFKALVLSAGRAGIGARGLITVIAAHRDAVGRDVRDPGASHAVLPPAADLINLHAAKAAAVREIVFGYAGRLTCAATCADCSVDEKSVLLAQCVLLLGRADSGRQAPLSSNCAHKS